MHFFIVIDGEFLNLKSTSKNCPYETAWGRCKLIAKCQLLTCGADDTVRLLKYNNRT